MISGNCLILFLVLMLEHHQADSMTQRIFWNAPFSRCYEDFNVSLHIAAYGITVNRNRDGWVGPNITIFTASEIGLYPYITENGTSVNGGLPQLCDFTAHLRKVVHDVKSFIPDRDFSGYAVIDYEPWRPIWGRDYDTKAVYQQKSKDLVRKRHPEWTEKQIEAEAKKEFEEAARMFMSKTVSLASSVRPGGKWGYYGFPRCYNYHGSPNCSNTTMVDNDRLHWLFEASSATYASAYLTSAANDTANKALVYGQVTEAFRVRQQNSPVLLYTRFRYGDTDEWMGLAALQASIEQAWHMRVNGIILWDDHHIEENTTVCHQLQNYIRNTLGPFCRNLMLKDTSIPNVILT